MELRSVEELMDLLYACRGAVPAPDRPGGRGDLHDHALRTAALLRRRRPADKELQVAGLVHAVGQLPRPDSGPLSADRAADAVGALLGDRVARLLRQHAAAPADGAAADDDVLALRQADEEARADGAGAGVLEDWRTVLELLAARNSRPADCG
ncbi:hypothetical protein [Streptomyces tropicalis]|uniref:HD domain-containing protein n=1 Tax=Streptomyces tropicalis TaxID=3034234 RepID=A0ABT6AAP5_9ACTN|nr:hypothetical protein [Streptomyces tropicalis]MDF3301706.1 hypothetical protein [Streptomyces tropicalis]